MTIRKNEGKATISRDVLISLLFRWLFLIILIPASYEIPKVKLDKESILLVLSVLIVYSMLVTFYIFRFRQIDSKMNYNLAVLDLIIISFMIYHLGGIDSDLFVLIIFVILYIGFNNNPLKNNILCIIALCLYTFSCFLEVRSNLSEINIWKIMLRDLFIIMATQATIVIGKELKKYEFLHKKEFKLARTDKLTGLANRHYFDSQLIEEVKYSQRTGNPLNVLIFDLDNFKRFNDSYGHVWGDKLLVLFSDIIKQNVRKSDIPVRFGGEEFLIIIRELDAFNAKSVAERIRRQLEKQKIYIGSEEERKKVTVSGGVARFPEHSDNIKEVIDFADKALYKAKESGKNVIISYDELIGKNEVEDNYVSER